MRIWKTVAEWREHRRSLAGRNVGFVPTMGALHQGHASLVERCRRENDIVVVSIFVNPAQFNDPKDLDRYPRTLDRDLALLESLQTDEVFMPAVPDLYPEGDSTLRVIPDASHRIMEGAWRPGFLEGMLTVVLKLLNIVEAHRAYFGEKDYQQLTAIKEMVRELFVSTEIIACTTVRDADGLAESSRNALLSSEARHRAAHLFRALTAAASTSEARETIEAHGFVVEYVEERWGRRLAAALLDGVRLIDNVPYAAHS